MCIIGSQSSNKTAQGVGNQIAYQKQSSNDMSSGSNPKLASGVSSSNPGGPVHPGLGRKLFLTDKSWFKLKYLKESVHVNAW